MNIYDVVNGVLSSAVENYYHGMPEFAENEEPAKYATYNVKERPTHYASGKNKAKVYWIYVSVFTPNVDTDFYDEIETAFLNAGAIYQGGDDVRTDTTYPNKKQYAMDFLINFEEE